MWLLSPSPCLSSSHLVVKHPGSSVYQVLSNSCYFLDFFLFHFVLLSPILWHYFSSPVIFSERHHVWLWAFSEEQVYSLLAHSQTHIHMNLQTKHTPNLQTQGFVFVWEDAVGILGMVQHSKVVQHSALIWMRCLKTFSVRLNKYSTSPWDLSSLKCAAFPDLCGLKLSQLKLSSLT